MMYPGVTSPAARRGTIEMLIANSGFRVPSSEASWCLQNHTLISPGRDPSTFAKLVTNVQLGKYSIAWGPTVRNW